MQTRNNSFTHHHFLHISTLKNVVKSVKQPQTLVLGQYHYVIS